MGGCHVSSLKYGDYICGGLLRSGDIIMDRLFLIILSSCGCVKTIIIKCQKDICKLALPMKNSSFPCGTLCLKHYSLIMDKLKLDKISPSPDLVSNDTYKGIFDG